MAETRADNVEKTQGSNGNASAAVRRGLSPKVIGALTLLFVVLAVLGGKYWVYSSHHEYTDDAALTNDVIEISPQVSGTVAKVLVQDNQKVKAGDVLVVLDDSDYKVIARQRKADLDAAIAQAKGAGLSVELTNETGSAQVIQAEGLMGQSVSNIAGAKVDVVRSEAATENAIAVAAGAEANVKTAQAGLMGAMANKKHSEAAVSSAEAQEDAAKAEVQSARALYDKAAHDADRYATLVARGAVSKQVYDGALSASLAAKAELEHANAVVVQRQADVNGAREQLDASEAGIEQAQAQLAASKDQATAAHMGVKQARAQQDASRQNVVLAGAHHEQAAGQLSQANTAPRQVAVSRAADEQAMAKIKQAKAALDAANLKLGYTVIRAPVDGLVNKKSVEEGALVEIGTPLMAIVPDWNVWVVANFKETQVDRMRSGQYATVDVDAFPKQTFKGHVDSLAAATGSTFALLPPDNATGNFVKVVQRVPVKIVLDPGQENLNLLRSGMSVTAAVDVSR
jgi:membrane fusion protein (multidrug efflux system)